MNALLLGWTEDQAGDRHGLYLADAERTGHLYVIGSTGAGKSKALASWALWDLAEGYNFGILDPHGDLIADVIANGRAWSLIRLIEFGAEEMVTMNPLEPLPGIDTFTQTLELVEVFRKIWELDDSSTPRLLEILRNGIWTLIEAGATLIELEPLLTNQTYRDWAVRHVTHEGVARFWRDRFDRWPDRDRTLFVESTLNKASSFTADPRLRLMLGAKKSTVDFREMMDRGLILLADLSKGVLRTNTNLIGALLLSRIQMAATSRLTVPVSQRHPWHLYVDEFQNYATDSFAELLSEARKMGLRLVLAHQSLAQLPERLRSIVLGNARSFAIFRCDRGDAELLVRYVGSIDPLEVKFFEPGRTHFTTVQEQWELQTEELVALPLRTAILKTKGLPPRRFGTFDVDVPERAVAENRRLLREIGLEEGWLRRIDELDEELAVRQVGIEAEAADAAEPTNYWEPPRGSD